MRSRSLLETPSDFSWKMWPSCQTLSIALEITKNIARVSLDGYLLNALCISLVIERSWLIVESPGRKLDCFGVKRLPFFSEIRTLHQKQVFRISSHIWTIMKLVYSYF